MTNDNPPCPYCGATLDDESQYSMADGRDDVEYACNTDMCHATFWTKGGWLKQQRPDSMLAFYE